MSEIDVANTSLIHKSIISKKSLLKAFYEEAYVYFQESTASSERGFLVEIGSGGGHLKSYIPEAISTDLVYVEGVDIVCGADSLPFDNESVSRIFALNVLHHLPSLESFLLEADRCLIAGGKIVAVEPSNTLFSRQIYKYLHSEPFKPEVEKWGDFPTPMERFLGWFSVEIESCLKASILSLK